MTVRVYGPNNEILDDGSQHRLYEIGTPQQESTVLYSKKIQRTAYIQANVVGAFNDWIASFFEPNYFKFTRIKSEANFGKFKSFMKDIYKKEKPFLVIDPASIEHDEESIFDQNMIGRYNLYDPQHMNIGAQLLYSMQIMKSDKFELVYRRDRYRFEFDIMIMEQNLDRQLNTYSKLLMNIRHNSKFLLTRTLPHLLPSKYIQNIAKLHGYDYQTEAFLQFLNSISIYPIIRRILPNGQYLFFMEQEMSLQVEVPGIPAKDSPDTSDAIEWGARITDMFIIRADLPTEFIFMIPEEEKGMFDKSIPDDPENISVISPTYADMDWPMEINGYKHINRVDIMLQEGDDSTLDIKPVVYDTLPNVDTVIKEMLQDDIDLHKLLMVKVYPNGSLTEAPFVFNNDGIIRMTNPEMDKLYTANIYLNFNYLNDYREKKNQTFIGTIEKY